MVAKQTLAYKNVIKRMPEATFTPGMHLLGRCEATSRPSNKAYDAGLASGMPSSGADFASSCLTQDER